MKNTNPPTTTTAMAPSIPVEDAPRFNLRADGSVELIRPRLELHGDIMQDRKNVMTLKRIWEPQRAIIASGMVIIEEWNLFLPLSYLHVGRWENDAPKKGD